MIQPQYMIRIVTLSKKATCNIYVAKEGREHWEAHLVATVLPSY